MNVRIHFRRRRLRSSSLTENSIWECSDAFLCNPWMTHIPFIDEFNRGVVSGD